MICSPPIAWRDLAVPRRALRSFSALVAVSFFVHFLGAHVYPSRFNGTWISQRSRLWTGESEPVLLTRRLLSPAAPDRSTPDVPAFWWTPEKNDDAIPGWLDASPGGQVLRGPTEVSGWAKSQGGEVDVRILLPGGRVIAPERHPRPDVGRAVPELGDTSRAGFRTVWAASEPSVEDVCGDCGHRTGGALLVPSFCME